MIKQICYEDIISLALLYNYEASLERYLEQEKINKFMKKVINILENNDNYLFYHNIDNHNPIDFEYQEQDGLAYLTIKKDINPSCERHKQLLLTSLDLVVASQREDALIELGLYLEDGKIAKKEDTPQKKYKFVPSALS